MERLLITGATGLVGSHVARRAVAEGIPTRALVRQGAETRLLDEWGVELVRGDLSEPDTLATAVAGVSHIVHAAAKVGDWGPVDGYRAVNVRSLAHLTEAAQGSGTLRRFVQISSLGVYEPRDHFGTDETTPPSATGLDGYTLSKIEAEALVLEQFRSHAFPVVVLRPGFIYGPRDRTVLPRLLERLRKKQVRYFGSGDQLLNQTSVRNLAGAIFLALRSDQGVGEVFNITDGHLVSKRTFIGTAARLAGYPEPTGHVPRGVARLLAKASEGLYRLLGKSEAPLVSMARYKFLGLNLDFSIDKARQRLGYEPEVGFEAAMAETIDWFRSQGLLSLSGKTL
jgi:2-alkyl-3-oxoalkanoate reductase